MSEIPSVKTHPVIVSLAVIIFTFVYTIACVTGGWFLRTLAESRAELSVVVDDGTFMQELEIQVQSWTEEYNLFDEEFHNENEIPDCLAIPMPSVYHDNDFSLQSDREHEE